LSRRAANSRQRPGKPQGGIEIKGDPAFFRRINYPAVGAGFVVALLVWVALVFLAQVTVLGPHDSFAKYMDIWVGISFLALFCGGLAAGLFEPKYGVLNGSLVAVVFIFVTWVITFDHELEAVKVVGPLSLGPMRVDKVFATDLPQLFFATIGGFTAALLEQRNARRVAASDAPRN
jgi:hypothetical protein